MISQRGEYFIIYYNIILYIIYYNGAILAATTSATVGQIVNNIDIYEYEVFQKENSLSYFHKSTYLIIQVITWIFEKVEDNLIHPPKSNMFFG